MSYFIFVCKVYAYMCVYISIMQVAVGWSRRIVQSRLHMPLLPPTTPWFVIRIIVFTSWKHINVFSPIWRKRLTNTYQLSIFGIKLEKEYMYLAWFIVDQHCLKVDYESLWAINIVGRPICLSIFSLTYTHTLMNFTHRCVKTNEGIQKRNERKRVVCKTKRKKMASAFIHKNVAWLQIWNWPKGVDPKYRNKLLVWFNYLFHWRTSLTFRSWIPSAWSELSSMITDKILSLDVCCIINFSTDTKRILTCNIVKTFMLIQLNHLFFAENTKLQNLFGGTRISVTIKFINEVGNHIVTNIFLSRRIHTCILGIKGDNNLSRSWLIYLSRNLRDV